MEDTGGTTSTLCEISPSDLASNVDNLMTRLSRLEQTVSQLLGADVTADQLSDLSEDAGWITGITFMGEPGWTQTPSGTLIPPPGWTGLSGIIDGQSGVTIYGGFSTKSTLHRIGSASGITVSDTIDINSDPAPRDVSYGTSLFTPTTFDTPTKYGWQILSAGVYDIDLYFTISASGATSGYLYVAVRDSSTSSNTILFEAAEGGGPTLFYDTISKRVALPTATTRYINVLAQNGTDAGSIDVYCDMRISLVREL